MRGPSLGVWLFFAGCSGAEPPSPTLRVAEPADGATVCGEPLHVAFDVAHFTLSAMDEGDPGDGHTGHVDVALSGQVVGMTLETAFDLPETPDGVYLLSAELVNPDHTPLEPPVVDEVTFTVDAAACP